ncbi:multidrug ABC transporter permease/ATP-binding protein, partial [Salmonella enterica subsp. enterica serovar Offa]|nr:multidrug ABC transporter permease/ATP-binding protein [Salmonella enterica subsp. enterica serovar Offa]
RFDPTIIMAIGMSNLLAVAGGSWMVMQGTLTLGGLTSFIMYLGLMIWPMLALAWMFNIVERGSAAYSRIQSLLETPPVLADGTESPQPGRGELSVAVDKFCYPESRRAVLHDIR